MKYNKISGFSDEISSDITVQLETLKKLGIEYFEPRGINGKNISELNGDEVTQLKQKMDDFGIKASSIGSPIGKIRLSENFEPHFELFKRIVEAAERLDTKYIRIFSFYHDGGTDWTSAERAEVLKRLGLMLDYAKEKDVILLHENEKDIYGDTVKRCLDLMQELSCYNFRAVFDPANFVQCKQNTLEAFARLSPYIEYMHIKDARENGDVVPSGMGNGNVREILQKLFENGYDGFLSLEPHLGSFAGLEALEADGKMTRLEKSSEEKFIIAYDALKNILEGI